MKIKFHKVVEFWKKSQTAIKVEMKNSERQIKSSTVTLSNRGIQLKRECKVLKESEKNWITQWEKMLHLKCSETEHARAK